MATLEEKLRKMGLWDRYQKVQTGKIKTPGFTPTKTTPITQTKPGTPVRHDGILYPSQDWYEQNVLKKKTVTKPFESKISAGKDYIETRTKGGLSADELSLKSLYRERGLESKYGTWRGSTQQYKAMEQFEAIETGVRSVTQKTKELMERVKTEGIEGQTRVNPQTGQLEKSTPAGWLPYDEDLAKEHLAKPYVPGGYEDTGVGDTGVGDYGETLMDGGRIDTTTSDIQMESTDFGDILGEMDTGDFATPELELSEADAEAQRVNIQAGAEGALSTLQQNLAQRGMTFSGIRTEAEESLAVETLSKLSGIDRKLAGKIINAVRQEQGRREGALAAQQKASATALKSMGYVKNPYTGKLEKTLEYKRLEQQIGKDAAQTQLIAEKHDLDIALKQKALAKPYWKPENAEKGIAYSGKYSEDYLARRAENLIDETGNIDWYAVDDLENTDKELYNDMVVFLQKALKLSNEEIEEKEIIEKEPFKGTVMVGGKEIGFTKKELEEKRKKEEIKRKEKEKTTKLTGGLTKEGKLVFPQSINWLFE